MAAVGRCIGVQGHKLWSTFDTTSSGHAVMLDQPEWLADKLLERWCGRRKNCSGRIWRAPRGLAGRSASRRRTASSHTCAAALTSAILDRVLHHAETVIIEGKSFRMKDEIDE